ncbi:MAG TPA: DUF4350 domain-containing protein [Solirubrobacteraceae bacterium]|jgi:hypothetical protein
MSALRRRLDALLPAAPAARTLTAILLILLAVNLVAYAADALLPSPSGPRSSSYATAPEGLAAWADLARGAGRDVRALRRAPSDASLPRSGTVVVLDPDALLPAEARALRRFAERGGRVVAGAVRPGGWVPVLLGRAADPIWVDDAPKRARVLLPAPETGAAADIVTAGEGAWRAAGETLPAIAAGDRAVLLLARAGRGRIALLADPSPLQNRLLARGDNATLALALAGPGPLYFAESVHGYGEARGLAALPGRFKWALAIFALAALIFVLARGHRLGPPEAARRELAPPRREYVDALAATLARARDRAAGTEPVRRAARERLARRAGLPDDAPEERVLAAARAAGLDDAAAGALVRPARDDAGVLAAGRALATLERPTTTKEPG